MNNITLAKEALKTPIIRNTTPPAPQPTTNTSEMSYWQLRHYRLTTICSELEKERKRQKKTKKYLAAITKLSPKTISYVMRGYTSNIHTINAVASALGMELIPTIKQPTSN